MVRKEITFGLQGGLQREAATDLIRCAVTFSSRLLIGKGEREANAKSLLGVLSLGITKGKEITIIADGSDEKEAVDGLVDLILSGFGS